MKRPYEITFILRIDPNEEVMREAITQVHNWLETTEQGKVTKADHWGRRKLAYEINGQREGYYVYLEADVVPAHIDEFERNMKLSSDVMRYLIVRPD